MRLRQPGAPSAMLISALMAMLVVPGAAIAQEAVEPVDPVATAQMRFLVGHQEGPADFYVDGAPVLEGLDFAQISDYVDVPAGEQLLQAVGQGMTLEEVRGRYDTGEFANVAETTQMLKADRSYTAVLNMVEGGIEFKVVEDKPKPKTGKAEARVISMCWACGPMGYSVAGEKKPLAKFLHYPEDKLAGKYVSVEPGELDLVPRVQGATDPLTDFDPIAVDPGTSHSLFVVGQDASFVTLVPVMDAAVSSVRFLNASREPHVVDVYVDGRKVAKRLTPGQATRKASDILAGNHLVQVVDAGTNPADGALHEASVDFPAGPVAVEAVAGESLEAVAAPTSLGPKVRTTQLRFAHIDPEIPAVDIELKGMEPVLGLAPGEWTDYLTVPGNSTYAWIRPSDNPTDTYHELPLDLGPGTNVTAYLGGSAAIPTVEFVLVQDPFAKGKKN